MIGMRISWVSMVCCYLLASAIYCQDYVDSIDTNELRVKHFARIVLWLYPALLVALLVLTKNWAALAGVAVLLSLGLVYATVFKGLSRHIPCFKNLFVSLMWILLVPLAVLCDRTGFELNLLWSMLFLFIGTFINVTVCDVKDYAEDRQEGLRTPVVILGASRLAILLHVLNVVNTALLVAGVYYGVFTSPSLALIIVTLYVAWYVNKVCTSGGEMAIQAHY